MIPQRPTQHLKQYPRCRKMLVEFGMGVSKSFELEKEAVNGCRAARKWIITVWRLDRQYVINPVNIHHHDLKINLRTMNEAWKH